MCGLTRVIWPAAVIGLAVASLAGNPVAGWLAAAAVAAVLLAIGRRSPARACAVVPPRPARRSAPQESSSSTPDGSCSYSPGRRA